MEHAAVHVGGVGPEALPAAVYTHWPPLPPLISHAFESARSNPTTSEHLAGSLHPMLSSHLIGVAVPAASCAVVPAPFDWQKQAMGL